jgi:hypothetical protein
LDFVEPWERLLWSGRPLRLGRRIAGEHYVLTDFRILRRAGGSVCDLALSDVGEVHRTVSRVDRFLKTSTVVVHGRRPGVASIELVGIRRGAQLAAILELLSGDARGTLDRDAIRAALAWELRAPSGDLREALGGLVVVLIAIFGVVIGLHGKTTPISYAADDAIAPNGEKRSQAAIVRFMEHEVMPWAREALGRIKGGAGRITCETCHGANAAARDWQMPAVAALPQPDVKERGWERYSTGMDAQMRNAIYGYIAESEKQAKAAYMREVVMPGMARLLHRPPYDFTKSYDYNRSHRTLGCYHCHKVK